MYGAGEDRAMAGRRPSRQELIRRRRSVGFIGRQSEVTAFRDALRQPPEEAAQFLFHVRGPAGVGKSTLVRHLETIAREGGALTAYVDESVGDVVETMEVISAQFAQQGLALKGFDKLLATYRQRRHEADAGGLAGPVGADPAVGGAPPPPPSPSSVVASQIGLAGLGMIPGVGAFTGAVDPNQVAVGADRVKALLSTRLRNHGDVELVLSPLDALTPVFLRELAEAAGRHPWIVLLFDTYERTGPLLDTWLRDVLGSERYGEFPANVLVVLAGQSKLAARTWEDWHDLVTDWPLEIFTETEARELLTGKGITDERVVEVILRLSGRLPVLVSTLAETQPGTVEEVEEIGDPSGTAVERFLKWVPGSAHRAAALACAFPQELDEDVYRAAVEEEAAELFGWLRSMPFVTDRSGHCRYHEVVRGAMLRLQRRQSPIRWEQLHTRLADAFRDRRAHLEEAPAPAKGWWSDETWRGYRLEEAYHRLCANPRTALPSVLRDFVDAYRHGITTLRRWVTVLTAAARDTDSSDVVRWSGLFEAALEEPEPAVAVLTLLLTRARLDTAGQALALRLRGREHRNAERYPDALADYTRTLELDPENEQAFFGRARTHHLESRTDEAIADYTRAVELHPENVRNLSYRSLAYTGAGRYAQALADLDRARELAPDDMWVFTTRGRVLWALKRYDDALAVLDEAVVRMPEDAFAWRIRGAVLQDTRRYEEALSDFSRSIDLNPEQDWAFTRRGNVLRSLGRSEDAVADFTRAIALAPDSAWAFSCRGYAHRSLVRYGDAAADFTRAIALAPDSHWALAGRGETHAAARRYEEALDDLSRAVELKPDYLWAWRRRSDVHVVLGRYEEALADFDQAVGHDSADHHTLAVRGFRLRKAGRCEEALADLDRSLESAPDEAWALTCRGLVLRVLGRYDRAAEDLTRAAGIQPDMVWAHYEAAVVAQLLGRPARDEHIRRVLELVGSLAPADLSPSDIGNRLLVRCLTASWGEVAQDLTRFLAADPTPGELRELLLALRSLVPVLPSAEPRIEGFCRVLEERLAPPPPS